jgi:serine/threonine-protein phosphatase 2A regulatory subunit A
MLDKLVNDDIPNIRFNVAKSSKVLIETLKKLPESGVLGDIEAGKAEAPPAGGCPKAIDVINNSIMPNLEKLQQDDDVDVRYFATVAAQAFTGDEMVE